MRDARRKAVRPANLSPTGRDGGRPRTQSAPEAALAAFRGFIPGHAEHLAALGFFAVLGAIVLSGPARLIEPDDLAYRASLYALRQGHLVLSNAQYQALNYQLRFIVIQGHVIGITQWDHLPDGSWISQKNPGYPFFVVPFFAAGLLRLAPLCYGGAACVALFCGARRWLGRWSGATAVGLFCSSGAAILFAWRPHHGLDDRRLAGRGGGRGVALGDPRRRRAAARFPQGSTLQLVRFYLPAVAVMALLGARLLVRFPRTAALACVVALGGWNFAGTHTFTIVPAGSHSALPGR